MRHSFAYKTALAPVLILGLVMALWLGPAMAQESEKADGPAQVVGWVQKADGQVLLRDCQGTERQAQVQGEVLAQDTLLTGPDGSAQVMFTDKTILALGENSELLVREAMAMDGSGAFDLEFVTGAARVLTSKVVSANPDKFKLSTPLGSVGIRGTEFGSLALSDHEAHVLYSGGPVVYAQAAGGDGGGGARAEACTKLAKAVDLTREALSRVTGSAIQTKTKLKGQLSDLEEKQAELGCGL